MKKLFAIFYLTALFACSHNSHKKHVANQHVKCYKQHISNPDGTEAFIYWYMICAMNNNSYYYYSSPTAISSYSNISWQQSDINPVASLDQKEFEQMEEQEVAVEEMSPDMQAEMTENAENFGGMEENEMGDYEGGTEDNSTDNSSDGGSDDGESDGDGDSGGGDGGDGGE